MSLNTRPWSDNVYLARRYQFIKQLEESNELKLTAYVDGKGIPTIGMGFNLRANQARILDALGVTRSNAADIKYYDEIVAILAGGARRRSRGSRHARLRRQAEGRGFNRGARIHRLARQRPEEQSAGARWLRWSGAWSRCSPGAGGAGPGAGARGPGAGPGPGARPAPAQGAGAAPSPAPPRDVHELAATGR